MADENDKGDGGAPPSIDYNALYGTLSEENKQVFSGKHFDKAGADGAPIDINGVFDHMRNMDKLIGTNTLATPRLDDDTELAKWPGWKSLGVPESPDKYELKRPEKLPDGMQWDEEGEKLFRNVLAKGKVPAKFAQAMFDDMVNDRVAKYSAFQSAMGDGVKTTEAQLRQAWGDQTEAKLARAKETAVTLAEKAGVKMDGAGLADRLQGFFGDEGALRVLDYLADAMGEDVIKGGGGGGGGNTPEGAKAEIGRLETDSDYLAAYQNADHPGHRAAVARMSELMKKAYPDGKK